MARLTSAEYEALRDKEDWKSLWVAAIPWVKFAATSIRTDHREDLIQTALLHMGTVVSEWDPAKAAFPTFAQRVAKNRMIDFLRRKEVMDERYPQLQEDDEATDDLGTHAMRPQLTYSDTGHVPEGYGDANAELERQHASDSVERFLAQLPNLLSLLIRESFGLPVLELHEDPKMLKDIASDRGIPRPTLGHQLDRAKKIMSANQRTAYVTPTTSLYPPEGRQSQRTHRPADRHPGFWNMGVASAMGDTDAWRESAGTVWSDWAWKPTDADILRGAKR